LRGSEANAAFERADLLDHSGSQRSGIEKNLLSGYGHIDKAVGRVQWAGNRDRHAIMSGTFRAPNWSRLTIPASASAATRTL
jgi:hypothetical protein